MNNQTATATLESARIALDSCMINTPFKATLDAHNDSPTYIWVHITVKSLKDICLSYGKQPDIIIRWVQTCQNSIIVELKHFNVTYRYSIRAGLNKED